MNAIQSNLDFGDELAVHGADAGRARTCIVLGAIAFVGGGVALACRVIGGFDDKAVRAKVVIGGCLAIAIGSTLVVLGLMMRRICCVLRQRGLTYTGYVRSKTVMYPDIAAVHIVRFRDVRSVRLDLRNKSKVELSALQDPDTVGRKIAGLTGLPLIMTDLRPLASEVSHK